MNILYLDFLFPKGHLNLDVKQINILAKIGKVTVLSPIGRYPKELVNATIIEKKSLIIKEGRISSRIASIVSMAISAIEANKNIYDIIIVSSFETITLSIGLYLFKDHKNIFIFHHFNTDELQNKIKADFFKTYKKKIKHVVYEEYIKNYLINSFSIKPSNVYVIPHPMNIANLNSVNLTKYDCIGLSNSNDEEMISRIKEIEEDSHKLYNLEYKVILKSQTIEYDDGSLKIIKGFISKTEYDNYINNTNSIFLPFPKQYMYRMSGTLIDALSNDKCVLGSDITLIRNYAKKYPEICKVINNASDFYKQLEQLNQRIEQKCEDFRAFKILHSEQNILNIFRTMIENDNVN